MIQLNALAWSESALLGRQLLLFCRFLCIRYRFLHMTLSLQNIQHAARRIASATINTRFEKSITLSGIAGTELFLKFENLQFTASFKDRGALNKLLLF